MTVIDYFGRKALMLVGSVGYLVSLGTVAWAFYTYGTEFTATGNVIVLGALMLFIASHAFGQGAVIWVFLSEIFPNRVRARGQALGSFTHWFMCALISWTFPVIADVSGGHAFAFFAAMMGGFPNATERVWGPFCNCSGSSSSCRKPRGSRWRRFN